MPEYPDITIYIERLNHYLKGKILLQSRIAHPFVLRTFDPPINEIHNKEVIEFRRMGKRIVCVFPDELFMIFHLMVAGRLQWRKKA